MSTADIGLIGLAVMGQNLVLNMNDHGFTVAVYNRTTSKVDEFLAKEAKGTQVIGAHSLEELVAALKPPRRIMLMVQSGQAGGRVHRAASAPSGAGRHPHRRRQLELPGHHPPHRLRGVQGAAVHRHRRVGRRGGGAARPLHHARRIPGGLAARQAHLPGHRRQGEAGRRRGGCLLRVGGGERRRALCQDGAQRHRVRRHAADLRGLPLDARRLGHERRRDAQGLRQVEQGQARLLPDRDHPRHPGGQGRGRLSRWWTRSWTPPSRRAPASGRASRPWTWGFR